MGISQADSGGAWWTEVEHLRERIERRREQEVSFAASRARRAPAEPDAGPLRHAAHGLATAESSTLAPRRAVRTRDRAVPAFTAPPRRPLEEQLAVPAVEEREVVEPAEERRDAPRERRYRARRRPRARVGDRFGGRPDRMAMWAFALTLLTVVIALMSAH